MAYVFETTESYKAGPETFLESSSAFSSSSDQAGSLTSSKTNAHATSTTDSQHGLSMYDEKWYESQAQGTFLEGVGTNTQQREGARHDKVEIATSVAFTSATDGWENTDGEWYSETFNSDGQGGTTNRSQTIGGKGNSEREQWSQSSSYERSEARNYIVERGIPPDTRTVADDATTYASQFSSVTRKAGNTHGEGLDSYWYEYSTSAQETDETIVDAPGQKKTQRSGSTKQSLQFENIVYSSDGAGATTSIERYTDETTSTSSGLTNITRDWGWDAGATEFTFGSWDTVDQTAEGTGNEGRTNDTDNGVTTDSDATEIYTTQIGISKTTVTGEADYPTSTRTFSAYSWATDQPLTTRPKFLKGPGVDSKFAGMPFNWFGTTTAHGSSWDGESGRLEPYSYSYTSVESYRDTDAPKLTTSKVTSALSTEIYTDTEGDTFTADILSRTRQWTEGIGVPYTEASTKAYLVGAGFFILPLEGESPVGFSSRTFALSDFSTATSYASKNSRGKIARSGHDSDADTSASYAQTEEDTMGFASAILEELSSERTTTVGGSDRTTTVSFWYKEPGVGSDELEIDNGTRIRSDTDGNALGVTSEYGSDETEKGLKVTTAPIVIRQETTIPWPKTYMDSDGLPAVMESFRVIEDLLTLKASAISSFKKFTQTTASSTYGEETVEDGATETITTQTMEKTSASSSSEEFWHDGSVSNIEAALFDKGPDPVSASYVRGGYNMGSVGHDEAVALFGSYIASLTYDTWVTTTGPDGTKTVLATSSSVREETGHAFWEQYDNVSGRSELVRAIATDVDDLPYVMWGTRDRRTIRSYVSTESAGNTAVKLGMTEQASLRLPTHETTIQTGTGTNQTETTSSRKVVPFRAEWEIEPDDEHRFTLPFSTDAGGDHIGNKGVDGNPGYLVFGSDGSVEAYTGTGSPLTWGGFNTVGVELPTDVIIGIDPKGSGISGDWVRGGEPLTVGGYEV